MWIPLNEWRQLPKVCGLYIIRHRESGKEYVGKSINVRNRGREHTLAGRRGYLHSAIRRHGAAAFEICVYMTGTEAEMLALEVLLIEERQTREKGYNLSLGGDGVAGFKLSDEQKAAISRSLTGRKLPAEIKEKIKVSSLAAAGDRRGVSRGPEFSALLSERLKGRMPARVWTKEALAKRSATNTGRKLRPRTESEKLRKSMETRGERNAQHGRFGEEHPASKPVGVWWPDALLPQVYDSLLLAAAAVGASRGTVGDWCTGKRKPRTGGSWAFL